jgi:hypothetical protein
MTSGGTPQVARCSSSPLISLEKLAQFFGRRLLLAGRLERLAMLSGIVAQAQELLASRRRSLLLRRPERRSRHAWSGHARHATELRLRRPQWQNGERDHECCPADGHLDSPSSAVRLRPTLRPL